MCPVDSFACDGIVCLNPHQKCDAVVNCKDGSDEINCDYCPGSFACALSKTCIPESYVCDGLVDCNDASDESNCSQLFKTCEELLNVGISESGMKILDGKYIYCDFEKDEIGNRIKITMIYHNVDWLHHRGAEYNLEPQKFIRDALTSWYTCSQKFTQETRQRRYVIKELANLTSWESNHVVLQYNPFESCTEIIKAFNLDDPAVLCLVRARFHQFARGNVAIYKENSSAKETSNDIGGNATTDTFEIHFTSESVQLRVFE
ncbi:uncharacterized protein LOC123539345 [Mercenaria mercenaria]|uniref:uncharacterized protein LOC123539345 n=1 Tax=Mercenaria mercenaria TaxID=6596 RepID=UPI00234EB7FB|nr:uncharacterized protein LOC123539345 [Mercenaria mercenaria]